jgi:4-hydroxy-3-methylbut-2-enyl diphosphate reductase
MEEKHLKVVVAKSAGFCFGVKRAVDMVYEQALTGKKTATFGPIIHNDEVVKDLEERGVRVIADLEELKQQKDGTVVIRSHGVSKEIYDLLQKQGVEIIDATCPFVKKIHNLVREHSEAGEYIIIIGNGSHPEVEGIKGWCSGPVSVIENKDEAERFTLFNNENSNKRYNKVCIVSQTTFNYKKFQDLVEIIAKKGYDILALNTICNATEERQKEAYNLAKLSDAMIVIGGKHSSNTQKLFEICKKECEDTYYIQTLVDLDLAQFKSFSSVGITAGASTPNNIIKEVTIGMAEETVSKEEFEQLLEGSLKTIHNGEVVEGTVIDVKEDEIILNIGYKSDGIITRSEYTNESNIDLTTKVNVGDTMQAKVLKVNDGEGQVVLTYKRLAAERGNKKLEEAFNNQEVLKAKVAAVLDGGLSVVVDEARIFIPASLVSDTYEQDLSKYAGQEIEFVITEFNPRRRRIIGNRKQLLLAKKKELQKQLFERISEGMTMEGTVKNVTDFGAFIDLGGADGLLHISEMSWGRVENPKKVFKVGDTVKVLIKEIKGEKIALSKKFDDENPWLNAAEKYATGSIVTGKVARMTDFGAFVELEPGVDALLHVSQIAKEHIEKPSDVLKTGQEVTAKVVDFNEEGRKISLSIKAMLNDQEKEEGSEE